MVLLDCSFVFKFVVHVLLFVDVTVVGSRLSVRNAVAAPVFEQSVDDEVPVTFVFDNVYSLKNKWAQTHGLDRKMDLTIKDIAGQTWNVAVGKEFSQCCLRFSGMFLVWLLRRSDVMVEVGDTFFGPFIFDAEVPSFECLYDYVSVFFSTCFLLVS
ncbi:hypothetical protein Hdeb2414_s0004g00131141 [Helianthus debilis subsp. tardiflorus]